MDITPEEFNKTIKAYYDNFSAHWDKALNAYEKLVVSLELPETPIGIGIGEVPAGINELDEYNRLNAEADIVISDFVRDTFNYYGAENLFSSMTYYHFVFCELNTIDCDAKKELNDIMAHEAKLKKLQREKTEKSKPLWNALKVS